MRTKNFLRNSIFSVASCLIIMLTGFVTRRVFLQIFSTEYLGYEGLFANIFSLMSLAELGIGGVISFGLYRELAHDNQPGVAKLMAIYRYIYRVVGIVVACIGVGLSFVLPLLIQEAVTDWRYVYAIYFGQLATVLCGYFLAYRRVLLVADQKEYMAVQVETVVSTTTALVKLIAMAVLHNYFLYLLLNVANNLVANIIIYRMSGKRYPFLASKSKVSREDLKSLNLSGDIKNGILVKIAGLVYGATDNLVITVMLGIHSVALFSNYMFIFSNVSNIISRVIAPIQAGIGNLVHSDQPEIGKKMYWGMDTLFMLIGAFTSVCFFVLMEPFVTLWVGGSFILPTSCLAALCMNSYVGYMGQTACYYRASFGDYHEDRFAMIMAAASNLVLSIVLAQVWGLTGIVVGTIIGHLFFQYARIKYVFKHYLCMSPWRYVAKHLLFAVVVCGEVMLTQWLTSAMPAGVVGLATRLAVCLVVPNAINLLLLCRTQGFGTIVEYTAKSLLMIWNKLTKHGESEG